MVTKKRTHKVEKRYYIDANNRIIKESKVNIVILSEVISLDEIIYLTELALRIIEKEKNETNNQ